MIGTSVIKELNDLQIPKTLLIHQLSLIFFYILLAKYNSASINPARAQNFISLMHNVPKWSDTLQDF